MMAKFNNVDLKLVGKHLRTRHLLQGDIAHEVNSFHSYSLAECPLGFEVSARTEDGEIEAISNKDMSWEGWMWHPEREADFHPRDIQRLRALFGE